MSTRISTLPVVVAANIADTDILPIVVGIANNTAVTSRVSVSEMRKKIIRASQAFVTTHSLQQVTASLSFWGWPTGAGLSSSGFVAREVVMPVAGTLTGLIVRTESAQPGDGALTVTIVIFAVGAGSSADTAIQIVIPAGAAAGNFSDFAHSVAFNAGDRFSIRYTNASASASTQLGATGVSANF